MNPIFLQRHSGSTHRAGALRIAILALALAATGCSTVKGWFDRDGKNDKPTEPTELSEFSPSTTVSRLWSAQPGGGNPRLGLTQGPVVADGKVYAAAVDGGVRAYDLQTGASAWHYKSKDALTGGPGAGDGLVVIGTLDGNIVALDAGTGSEKWTVKVPSEIIAAPVIGQGMVLVRSNDGRITAFDTSNGERRWFWNHDLPTLTVRGNDGVVLGPGYVFVGNDDGTVAALSLSDGRPLWEQTVGQPDGRTELDRMADIDGTPALDGATLFASSYKKQTMAIDAPSGRPLWAQEHGGAGRVGVASDRVVVADPAGIVWALDKTGGSALWQQPGLARRNLSGAVIHGDYAVVGDYDGYLHWLRIDNGDFGARMRLGGGAVRAAPIVAGDILVAQSVDGDLSAYRLSQ